ncbi:hypothetical protein ABW19_dt0204850 [Dactylella cylindrospora]|nr:hypothetical protein ABW19_dt0204850 [Dactylella cylindrospora]
MASQPPIPTAVQRHKTSVGRFKKKSEHLNVWKLEHLHILPGFTVRRNSKSEPISNHQIMVFAPQSHAMRCNQPTLDLNLVAKVFLRDHVCEKINGQEFPRQNISCAYAYMRT